MKKLTVVMISASLLLVLVPPQLKAGWTRTYEAPYYPEAHYLQQTSDGGYILGGTNWDFLKVDDGGNILWST